MSDVGNEVSSTSRGFVGGGTLARAGMAVAHTPRDVGAVPAELAALTEAVSYLDQVAGQLVSRIDPVLAPQPPEKVAEGLKDGHPVGVVHAIKMERQRIQRLADALHQVINRIEL